MDCSVRWQSMIRVIAVLTIALAAIGAISGCWDKREIEEIGFVVGAAIDLQPETGDILLTAQIAKPFAIGTGAPGTAGVSERAFWSVEGTGKTVSDAIAQLNEVAPRTPFWAHNDLVIFGEAFARQGIGDALDFLVRQRQSRLRVRPVVVKGFTGHFAAFSTESELTQLPSEAILDILQSTAELLSTSPTIDVNQMIQVLESPLPQFVLPVLELIPMNPAEATFTGELKREIIAYSPRINGCAVFNRDRLVGFLSQPETRGRQSIVGGIDDAAVVVPHPRDPEKAVCLTVTGSSSKIECSPHDGNPHFNVRIEAQALMAESQTYIDVLDSEIWSALEKSLAEAIHAEARLALTKAQLEFRVDVFGFGEILYQRHTKLWHQLSVPWEEAFATASVDISVEATLVGGGLTLRSPRVKN